MSKKTMTYEKAIKELQEVVNDLRDEMVSVDDMTTKVNRAKKLMDFCKKKLRNVGDDMEGMF